MSETTIAYTPIQLASLLQEELKPITGNNVPPQMIYNYITNNTRNINSFTTKMDTQNKDGKKVTKTVFPEDKALQFIQIMVEAATKRKEKKELEAAEGK
jgi:hypothetical protein